MHKNALLTKRTIWTALLCKYLVFTMIKSVEIIRQSLENQKMFISNFNLPKRCICPYQLGNKCSKETIN